MLIAKGATRLFAKRLAPNDNSKNQVYVGGNPAEAQAAFEVLPPTRIEADTNRQGQPSFKGPVDFWWVDDEGPTASAPNAQLIYYPQYPEVRFSGFLRGCPIAPSQIMVSRDPGRVLVLGVRSDGRVLGHAAAADSPVGQYVARLEAPASVGVFVPLEARVQNADSELFAALCELSSRNWLPGVRLTAGGLVPCTSSNCGGVTLEAMLGIRPNSYSRPDYLGWELKAFKSRSLDAPSGGVVTIMTPEPNGGCYVEQGAQAFVRRFGYSDMSGRPDRLNFGGVYRAGMRHTGTCLTLRLRGFDAERQQIIDATGGIELVTDEGEVAAAWSMDKLLDHWRHKHAKACYVPYLMRPGEYRYGSSVLCGVGTGFAHLLAAFAAGTAYYDPGIKLENASTLKPILKRRSQFRVRFADLARLYEAWNSVDVCGGIRRGA